VKTFAPRGADAPEADGYLILPLSRFMEGLSEFLIFDTQCIAAGPIARIELPFQIGWTPHGHWMDFSAEPSIQRSRNADGGSAAAAVPAEA
jgi:carotenoid cleavage dioxygenase